MQVAPKAIDSLQKSQYALYIMIFGGIFMLNLFFANPSFRTFTLFSAFSGIGHGMFAMFMLWVVHALFQNPIYTGLAGLMFTAPLIFSFLVGPLVDRLNKRGILRFVELIQLIVAAAVLLSHLYLELGIWFYLTAILLFSAAGLFSGPAHTAFLPRLIDGGELARANALLSMAGIIGGLAIGVVLYMLMRQGADFALVYGTITAVLALAFLLSLALKDVEKDDEKTEKTSYADALKAGFAFVKKGAMLAVVFFMAGMSLFSQIAYVNFPMFAEIHLGTAQGYILLSALAMLGGLVGSWIFGMLSSKIALGRMLVLAFILAGIARILFVHFMPENTTRAIWIYIAYVGLGYAIGIVRQVLVQKLPPKELVSRVDSSLTSLAAIAGAAGAAVGGFLGAHVADIDHIFIVQGISYVGIGLLLVLFKRVRNLPKITEM